MPANSAKTRDVDVLIGRNLKSIRTRAGVTQEILGKSLGVSFQQIQKYEKGKSRMPVAALIHFQHVLRCNLAEFFAGINLTKINSGDQHITDESISVSSIVNIMPAWKRKLALNIVRQLASADDRHQA